MLIIELKCDQSVGEPLATFWFQIKSKVRYKHSKTTRFCIVRTSRCLLSNWSVSRHLWFGVIMVHQHIIWMVTRIRPISFTKIIIQLKENILARYFYIYYKSDSWEYWVTFWKNPTDHNNTSRNISKSLKRRRFFLKKNLWNIPSQTQTNSEWSEEGLKTAQPFLGELKQWYGTDVYTRCQRWLE